MKEKITEIKPKQVKTGFSSYLDYLTESLTVSEFSELKAALNRRGISSKQMLYNLNRPARMEGDLIHHFAELIHGSKEAAPELVLIYGLGREKLTIDEAEKLNISLTKKAV